MIGSVDDWARAFVRAMEHPMPGDTVHIADDEYEPLAIRFVADTLDAPNPFGIPAPMFRLLGGNILGEMVLSDIILGNDN